MSTLCLVVELAAGTSNTDVPPPLVCFPLRCMPHCHEAHMSCCWHFSVLFMPRNDCNINMARCGSGTCSCYILSDSTIEKKNIIHPHVAKTKFQSEVGCIFWFAGVSCRLHANYAIYAMFGALSAGWWSVFITFLLALQSLAREANPVHLATTVGALEI